MLRDLIDLSTFAHQRVFPSDTPWDVFTHIHAYLLQQEFLMEGEVEPGAFLINPEQIALGKGSRIEAGAYVKGPCIIGQNSVVRHGAYIRGDVIIGDGCVVGHTTEVKNSIFCNGAKAAHFAYIGDSLLGNNVNLGAGTKCANVRFDRQNIEVDGVDTGLRKLGAIFGDGSQTGCNSVTNPGTILEKNTLNFSSAKLKRARYATASSS